MLKIRWSISAKEEYAYLLSYIEAEFGIEAALKFMDATDKVVDTISIFPNTFPYSKSFGLRKAVVTKQTSLLYRTDSEFVDIVNFWDNRQSDETYREVFGN